MSTPDTDSPLVFIVEDEPDIARLIATSLAEYGFRSETFGTGRSLLARARKVQPELAILDMKLKKLSGVEVLEEIRKRSPETREYGKISAPRNNAPRHRPQCSDRNGILHRSVRCVVRDAGAVGSGTGGDCRRGRARRYGWSHSADAEGGEPFWRRT